MAKAKKTARKRASRRSRKKIKVAFIGAGGRAGMVHYPSIRDLPNAEIVAISELNEERLHSRADEFRVKGRYTNYNEMIEKEKPDVVYAIMGPQFIFDVAMTVMEMGCNLVIEKPPALTSEQTRMLAVAARKNKVITGVTTQRRFAPVIRTGKKLVEERGPIHTADTTFIKCAVGGAPIYRGIIDLLTCDGIHAVDTLRYLCGGEVEDVASSVKRLDADHCNVVVALVQFSTGTTGTLRFGYMMGRRIFSVEAHGPGISLFGDPEEGGRIYADGQLEPQVVLDPHEMTGSTDHHKAYGAYQFSEHFIGCVRKGKQAETNFDDALKTMELIDAIYLTSMVPY